MYTHTVDGETEVRSILPVGSDGLDGLAPWAVPFSNVEVAKVALHACMHFAWVSHARLLLLCWITTERTSRLVKNGVLCRLHLISMSASPS